MTYMRDAAGVRLDTIRVAPLPSPTPTVAPTSPRLVSALTLAAGTAQVSWSAPHGTSGLTLTYTVTASTGQSATVTTSNATASATVTGLTNGTPVTFTVTAANTAGASPASAASNSVTPAADPLGLSISGLVLSLDADSVTGVANGASVATLPDASGNGLSGIGAGGSQPTMVTSWQNAHAALAFDGTTQTLKTGFTTALVTGHATLFAVFDLTATQNTSSQKDMRIFSNEVNTARTDQQYGYEVDALAASGNAARAIISGNSVSSSALTLTTPYLVSLVTPGLLYLNGTVQTGQLTGPPASTSALYLGSIAATAKRFAGRIAHLRIYNRVLTAAERHSVEASLAGKYGLTVAVN